MEWTLADVERSIPDAFAAQVQRRPENVAVSDSALQVTYGDLDAAANRHAQLVLDRRGLGAARIALLLPDDAGLFGATLGVLKAGKAAVVLNVADPAARLAHIIEDAEPELVLTDPAHAELGLAAGTASADLVVLGDRADRSREGPPDVRVDPGEIAFLIYTSGSTGRPKGVIHTHRSWLHGIARISSTGEFEVGDRVPIFVSTSTSGGSSILWTVLLNGAATCLFLIPERGLTGLASWAAEQRITSLSAPASAFRHLIRSMRGPIPSVRNVGMGAEPVMPTDIEACRKLFGPECVVSSGYGSTEVGMLTLTRIGGDEHLPAGPVPMGRAVDWVELLVLDDEDEEVPPGEIGEITVRCDYLSPGYWRDEELTAARFSYRQGHRIVRTGDLGTISADGIVSIVGRRDLQVKVRGNRIALSEVEAALIALPDVTGATVCAHRTATGNNKLTAFLTTSPAANLSAESVRKALRTRLPQREMPSAIVFVDHFPFNPYGKVDRELLARRAALPAPNADDASGSADPIEDTLAVIFADAFEVEHVGVDQDFFALSGDSLTAHVIAAAVHELFGVQLDLLAILDNPTVARLAPVIESLRSGDGDQQPPLERVSREDPVPLSFAQERTWRFSRTPEQSAGYTDAFGMVLRGALDVDSFRRAVDHLVRRHEMLRTTFAERDGHPVQVIHPATPFEIELIDLSSVPDGERRPSAILAKLARVPFDLERGPLLRLHLFRAAPDEHYLFWVDHHIISDGWSVKLFFDELGTLYEALHRRERAPIPDRLEFQYADFAARERRWLEPSSRYYKAELAWWQDALREAPALELPFARQSACPEAADPAEGVIHWGLAPRTSEALGRLGREANATYYMVRLALLAAQLALDSGSDDLVLGTYVTGRRMAETQAMFGYFVNTVSLRVRIDPGLSFRELLARVRACVIETSRHSDFPYEELCERLRGEGIVPPELRLIFNPSVGRPWRIPGLEVTPMRRAYATMPWGFSFNPNQPKEADECEVSFDARIHDPDGVREFLARFERLAGEACAQPDRALDALAADLTNG